MRTAQCSPTRTTVRSWKEMDERYRPRRVRQDPAGLDEMRAKFGPDGRWRGMCWAPSCTPFATALRSLAAGYCAQLANCFGAPLVGARGFLGFHPLLFGMEREPAAPAGSTLFTFQDIAEYTGPLGGSRPRHHVRGKRSAVLSHECSIFVRGRAAPARDSRQDAPRPAPHMKGRKCKWPNLSQCRSIP